MVAYISLVVLARILPAVSFGYFSFALSIMALAGTVANGGASRAIIRFLGQYRANGQADLEYGANQLALTISLAGGLLTIVVSAGVMAVCERLSGTNPLGPDPVAVLSSLSLLVAYSLTETYSSILRSYGFLASALAPRDIVWRSCLMVIASVVYGSFPAAQSAYLAFTILGALSLWSMALLQHMVWRREAAHRFGNVKPAVDQRLWWSASPTLWGSSVAGMAFRSVDVVILGFLVDPAMVGGYFIASRASTLVDFVHTSINVVAGPAIAHSFHERSAQKLRKYLVSVAAVASASAGAVFLILCVFGQEILEFVDPSYGEMYWPMIILSCGRLVSALCGSNSLLLEVSGHHKPNFFILLASVVMCVLAMPLLVNAQEFVGAAVAISGAQIIGNLAHWGYGMWRVGFDTSVLGIKFVPRWSQEN